MSSITATTTSLLDGLRDRHNDACWMEFNRRYYPPLTSFVRRVGLNPHDAEDVVQNTLATFAQAYWEGKYDPQKGRLRTYLLGIVKNKIREFRRAGHRNGLAAGGTEMMMLIQEQPDEDNLAKMWEEEWHSALLRNCLEEARKHFETVTMEAFEMYALRGIAPAAIAERLGISRDSVYQARSRVLKHMQELEQTLSEAW